MSLREYIQNNHWWKLLSLLLATLTWFTIRTGFHRELTLQESAVSAVNTRPFPALPITVMTTASDTRGFKVSPERVFVKIIGKKEKLEALEPKDIGVFVNLTGNQDADRLRKGVQVHVPEGLIVVSVFPPEVDVERIPIPGTAASP